MMQIHIILIRAQLVVASTNTFFCGKQYIHIYFESSRERQQRVYVNQVLSRFLYSLKIQPLVKSRNL